MRKHILILSFTLINLIGLLIIFFYMINNATFGHDYEKYMLIYPVIVITFYPIGFYTFYRVIMNNEENNKSFGIRLFFYNDYETIPIILLLSPFYIYDYIKYFIKDFMEYRGNKNG